MREHFFQALKLILIFLVIFPGLYTLAVWGVAQLAPNKGKGFLIDNTYYENVGQKFTHDKYFSSRPSAVDYNAAGSGGSNQAPFNAGYLLEVQARIDDFILRNPGIARSEIPADLITASGSGLDPHISVQSARVQVKRIAKIRKIREAVLVKLIEENTEMPLLGLFGTEKVHVLKLNLALDKSEKVKSSKINPIN